VARPDVASLFAGDLPVLRAMVAFDMCSFGDLRRTIDDQMYVRDCMYGMIVTAFRAAGIPWESCHDEDRGDGLIMVIPAEFPTSLLVEAVAVALRKMLRLHNRRHSELSQIRLRMAVHAGHLAHDGKGMVGRTPVHLARLLDASEFKAALAATSADLGLIVSDYVYDEVVLAGIGFMEPEDYHRLQIEIKETRCPAWVSFPPGSWTSTLPVPAQGRPLGVHTPGAGVRNIS
jgi:hypothetical protein